MFQNQASDATFQNLPPDAIFCDHASDVYHEWYSVDGEPLTCNELTPGAICGSLPYHTVM